MTRAKKRVSDEQSVNVTPPKCPKLQFGPRTQVDTPTRASSIFPFFKLPGEIRNRIYEYALVDKKFVVHFEAGVSEQNGRCTVVRLYHAWSRSPDRDDLDNKHYTCVSNPGSFWVLKRYACATQHIFHVQMLQVCRQMNYEAAPFFYGKNQFVFEAICHLYAFLKHFKQRGPYLRKIGLKSRGPYGVTVQDAKVSWAQKSQHKVLKPLLSVTMHMVLLLLTSAINFEAVYLSAGVLQSLWNHASNAAHVFYQQAREWLRSLILLGKDPLDIIKIPKIQPKRRCKLHWSLSEGGQNKFLTTLARLLSKDEAELMIFVRKLS